MKDFYILIEPYKMLYFQGYDKDKQDLICPRIFFNIWPSKIFKLTMKQAKETIKKLNLFYNADFKMLKYITKLENNKLYIDWELTLEWLEPITRLMFIRQFKKITDIDIEINNSNCTDNKGNYSQNIIDNYIKANIYRNKYEFEHYNKDNH